MENFRANVLTNSKLSEMTALVNFLGVSLFLAYYVLEILM